MGRCSCLNQSSPRTTTHMGVFMSPLRSSIALLPFLLIAVGLTVPACTSKSPEPTLVERGKYLVTAGGCNDCHSPKILTPAGPIPDTTRLLSGHRAGSPLPPIPKGLLSSTQWGALTTSDMTAWAGPWGVSFAYNLTPDMNTGLGGWTEDMFIQTMRKGKFMGMARDILPPMPWQEIGQMTDDDLKAIFAYLQSLPPIENPVPAPIPPGR
jgi:hypothetical protein